MGFLRKTVLIGTGGLAPIKANSKKERVAKAAEKQLKVQRELLRAQQQTNTAQARQMAIPPPTARAATITDGSPSIVILAPGDKKIQVIKIVRTATGLGLKQAKELVDNAPARIRLSAERITDVEQALVLAGATVETHRLPEVTAQEPADDDPESPDGPSPTEQASLAHELERIAELHGRGVLTDEEFIAAKSRVLNPDSQ